MLNVHILEVFFKQTTATQGSTVCLHWQPLWESSNFFPPSGFIYLISEGIFPNSERI